MRNGFHSCQYATALALRLIGIRTPDWRECYVAVIDRCLVRLNSKGQQRIYARHHSKNMDMAQGRTVAVAVVANEELVRRIRRRAHAHIPGLVEHPHRGVASFLEQPLLVQTVQIVKPVHHRRPLQSPPRRGRRRRIQFRLGGDRRLRNRTCVRAVVWISAVAVVLRNERPHDERRRHRW